VYFLLCLTAKPQKATTPKNNFNDLILSPSLKRASLFSLEWKKPKAFALIIEYFSGIWTAFHLYPLMPLLLATEKYCLWKKLFFLSDPHWLTVLTSQIKKFA
jgi:hypothetical protein